MLFFTENPWEISEADFPAAGTPAEKLRFLLHYAVLAPSSHNTQPWLFRILDDEVYLYADTSRVLPVVDPDNRELTISCGAALFHLRIALRHFGYAGPVETFPHPYALNLLARIGLGNKVEAAAEEHALFQAILKRRTNRQAFEDRPVPESLLAALQQQASQEGTWFHIVEGEAARNAVADLIAEGDRIQWADKRFRRELAAWMHPNRSRSRDGMPGSAQGLGDVMSYLGPLVIRTFDMGDGQAAKDRQLATGSPVLAVLGSAGDTVQDWLSVGQALSSVLLYARAQGVWVSFLNQPIEVPELGHRLHEILGRGGSAQLLLRMGYGPEIQPTPRRGVSEVFL